MLRRVIERCLLVLFPRAFRDRVGRPMIQTLFADSRRSNGRLAVGRLASGAIDVARAGIAERRRRPAPRAAGPADETRPSVGARAAGLASDASAAVRVLRHRPAFSIAVVATLAIGLGAATAMFAVIDAVLLRPLGYPDDRALVLIGERESSRNLTGASLPALGDYAAFPELASLGAYTPGQLLFQQATPERAAGMLVSPGFFHTLGVPPLVGTVMAKDDPLLDPAPKIVLGYDLWRRQFASDPAVVGRAISLESRDYTVLGVMPRGFSFPTGAEFWTTLPPTMRRVADERSLRIVDVVARLRTGVEPAALRNRLHAWAGGTGGAADDRPGDAWTPFAESLRDRIVGEVRPGLVAAFAGVCLLLLVACANAAALVLAHGRSRLRDLAVQSALGASRARLARAVVLEGLALSAVSAGAALSASVAVRHAIVELSINQIPRIDDVAIGGRVAVFAAIAAAIVTLLITAAPAWLLTRPAALSAAASSSRTAAGSRSGRRVFGGLVAVEFALAVALTAGSGLLFASYQRLRAVDNGVAPGRVLTMRVNTPLTPAWTSDVALRRLHEDLLSRLATHPGVVRAAIAARLPMDAVRGGVDVWSRERPDVKVRSLTQTTSDGFVEAVGATLSAGRDFAAADHAGAPTVALVNATLARALWPGEDPIGRVLDYQYFTGPVRATVIGVVQSIRYGGLTDDLRPEVYVSFRQGRMLPQSLVIRSTLEDPTTLVPAVRALLGDIDPTRSVTVDQIVTLDDRMARAFARPRFFLVLFGAFGATAFLLAAFGIYGTMTFWINERWRELGIRLALGATRQRVVRLVVARGLAVASAGLLAGLVATVFGSRVLQTLLFGVRPTDPATLAIAVAALALVALIACVLPARRISRLDPTTALRD